MTAPLRLLVSYDGTELSGFAAQPGRRTVQGELEAAIGRLAGRPVRVTGAGRTDAGVHALGQVVSLDPVRDFEPDRLLGALAGRLPRDISVVDAAAGPDGFDARASALYRTYVYLVWNADAPDPVLGRFTRWFPRPLDTTRLADALAVVRGTHDFRAFARVREDQSPVRTIHEATAERDGPVVRIRVTGLAFLHNMVRGITGSALEVATGRRPVSWMGEVLAGADRSAAGPVAPPEGLTLVEVGYPEAPWPRRRSVAWPYAGDRKMSRSAT